MEEKKLANSTNSTNPEQPTYEQLKDWCNQLLIQRNQLNQRLNQVSNVMNKLPWLFETLKLKESFSAEFVQRCVEEIEFIMTPPSEEDEVKEEKTENPTD